ncbi:HPr family phosphocarrier protein [Ferrimonas senticii]|uniref:HPr family phosphocarrier protein n=1 Tax=Ferrimonas senticii TaxID=394566 RepID=UPI000484BCC9|nr:HPr family phosphocarrier protein [Ferrimonas senticii]
MATRDVTIAAPYGLHTRPAAVLVRQAQRYDADIILHCDGEQANCKSLFKLQMLNLCHGSTVTIEATGDDADLALRELTKLLKELR